MMEINLEHEDLLIKLRAKLNEGKIKLWESPYVSTAGDKSQSFQDLGNRLASELSLDVNLVLDGLLELQQHSIERSKANNEFKETGCATFRIKATGRQKKGVFNVMKKLNVTGSELVDTVAEVLGVENTRLKLIFNGKVINHTSSLEEQGVQNGIQIMALIMAENPDSLKQEDNMYMQMKMTLEDAALLSDCYDDCGDEQYLNLEDQTGKSVELPKSERKSLFIGLALHDRGRTCIKKQEYSFALVLLLEADRQLSECGSQILTKVDNYGVLQLDIAWCYLCLRSLPAANDAATRLAACEVAFINSYGPEQRRLIALKGSDSNERVLFMRLYLMQGIVAYHQNKRARAKELLDKAQREINNLKVDVTSVQALMELGWSECQAYAGLRATQGDLNRAHNYLDNARCNREKERLAHKENREQLALGLCKDGSPVNKTLVDSLKSMGYSKKLAVIGLRNANNNVTDAVRIIQEQPEVLHDSDLSDEEESTEAAEADKQLLSELCSMGFESDTANYALQISRNNLVTALDILRNDAPCTDEGGNQNNPSTSAASNLNRKRQKKEEKRRKKKGRVQAIRRLHQNVRREEDDYLGSSLSEEEHFLTLYQSLL